MPKLQISGKTSEETFFSENSSSVEARIRVFQEQDGVHRSGIFSELTVLYRPMLESLILKYSAIAVEHGLFSDKNLAKQELTEEADIALWRAAMTYREDSHTTFGLYAKVCVRNRLVSCLRRERQSVLPAENEYAVYEDYDSGSDPEELYTRRETFADYYKRFTDAMTEYEKSVFRLYIAGASYKQIAKRLETSEKSVGNAVYRVRKKLKDTMR